MTKDMATLRRKRGSSNGWYLFDVRFVPV